MSAPTESLLGVLIRIFCLWVGAGPGRPGDTEFLVFYFPGQEIWSTEGLELVDLAAQGSSLSSVIFSRCLCSQSGCKGSRYYRQIPKMGVVCFFSFAFLFIHEEALLQELPYGLQGPLFLCLGLGP